MALDPALQAAQLPFITQPLVPGLFIPHVRSIGGIPARVTIEESGRDEVTVTQHPVEQGAPIADHAYKQPNEVTIRCGWNLQDGDLSAESGVYGIILGLQAAFIPFDLVTGKRLYHNMLIVSVVSTTDSNSEYALLLTLTCREVILTSTQTAQTNNGSQADPSGTGTTVDKGPMGPQAAPEGSVNQIQDQIDQNKIFT